eukprot:COSAG05_NODE_12234_length_476_cov_0.957560_1_plen_82_part_10
MKEEIATHEKEVREMEHGAASEQRRNREPTAGERDLAEVEERKKMEKRNATVISTFHCMHSLLADLPGTLIIGTDGGGILED